jgi:aspartate aminotransferase
MAPIDPIIGLNEEFAKDPFPGKVIVGVGAYRDEAGKPYVLPCVREAERRMTAANLDMEYSGIVRAEFRPVLSRPTTATSPDTSSLSSAFISNR